ncbi:MAG TPA: ELWxxDGT repeat protein [Thermoanaerobaculia bacterium]|nr:ELWxxDGT repeat protein [Thermoanaerobaculia bacterium]
MAKFHIALVAALLGSAPLAAAQLVKDLNHGPADPGLVFLSNSAPLHGVLYFSGWDPAHGSEVWRSDGTTAGTYRVTDVCPGRCDSQPGEIRAVGDLLYFSANDGFSGEELWVSDGLPGHERKVKDVCLGPCPSNPQGFAAAGGQVLFSAQLGQRRQLWATDGTAAGTRRVATICSPAANSGVCSVVPGSFLSVGNRALFEVFNVDGSADIWTSDGTAAGTLPLKALVTGFSAITSDRPVAAGSFAYFWTRDGLWQSDGTAAGTFRVKALDDLVPPAPGVDRTDYFDAVSGGLLYTVLGSGHLIRSDGTPEGTFVLHKFTDGSAVNLLTPLGDGLVFKVDLPGFNRSTLWASRGTPETTVQIADVANVGYVDAIASLGSRAVFRVVHQNDSRSTQLWVTDGTAPGTALLVDGLSEITSDLVIFSAAGQAFFLQPGSAATYGVVLWAADGTINGTRRLYDFSGGPGSGGPLDQAEIGGSGGRLLFAARISPTRAPLFVSDGTAAGTFPVSGGPHFGTDFTSLGGAVLFSAGPQQLIYPGNTTNRNGLWRSDGTTAGTVKIADLFRFDFPQRLGGRLLFAADDSQHGNELWASDGTAKGTTLIKDINLFSVNGPGHHNCVGAASSPGPGAILGNLYLFGADDGVHGRELWASDGTARGTRLVKDINPLRSPIAPGSCSDEPDNRTDSGLSSFPGDFVRLANGTAVLFAADDGTSGRELWRSDGTATGTRRLADLLPGAFGSAPHDLTRLGNVVYFFASPTGTGEALFKTDGTAQGTVLVSDLRLNGTPSWARDLTVSGGKLFFVVNNELIGAELWTSQGDQASTRIVADLKFGPASSTPKNLTDVGGVLLFAADDGTTGLELWRSDGTGAGTLKLADINPGPSSSSPGPFTVVGNQVFFGADDGVHGRELWTIPVADVVTP